MPTMVSNHRKSGLKDSILWAAAVFNFRMQQDALTRFMWLSCTILSLRACLQAYIYRWKA